MLYLIAFIVLGCMLAGLVGWVVERRRRGDVTATLVAAGSDLSEQSRPARGLRRWFSRQPGLLIPPGVCAALIPAHNEEAVIGRCLKALTEGVPDGEDVVIYDDLSAGAGRRVGVREGGEAAAAFYPEKKPVDAYCACILDHVALSSQLSAVSQKGT